MKKFIAGAGLVSFILSLFAISYVIDGVDIWTNPVAEFVFPILGFVWVVSSLLLCLTALFEDCD